MTIAGRRVAVTGIGIVCALGTDRDGVWAGLLEGRCGMAPVSLFDAHEYPGRLAAEVPPGFADSLTQHERRRLSRCDQIAVVAAREALHDAGFPDAGVAPERIGVILGAGTADLLRGEEYYADILAHDWNRARPVEDLRPLSQHFHRCRRRSLRAAGAAGHDGLGLLLKHGRHRARGRSHRGRADGRRRLRRQRRARAADAERFQRVASGGP